jgi:myo-inositol-1(or 4)-monophosphatase
MALAHHGRGFEVQHKADGSKVTSVDLAVDKFLHEALLPQRPGYGWLSEEQPDDGSRLETEKFFVVDPIDGTSAFASGDEHWCVAAGIADEAGVVACALYQPRTNRLFHAARGIGAWSNGSRLQSLDSESLEGARLLATGRTRHALEPAVKAGSTSLPLLMRFAALAANEGDIALSLGPRNDWDLGYCARRSSGAGSGRCCNTGRRCAVRLQIACGKTEWDFGCWAQAASLGP